MALSNTTVKQTFQGDGATVAFAIPHALIVSGLASSEVTVYRRAEVDVNDITQTLQVEGGAQDYTLTGGTPPTTVTFNTAPLSTDKIIIIRVVPRTQTLDLNESGDFPAEDFENSLDRLSAQVQELQEELNRIPKMRISEQFGDTTLDQPFKNSLIWVNDNTNGYEFASPSQVVSEGEGGFTGQGSNVTILNSQASVKDVTNLTIDNTVFTSAYVALEVTRTNIFTTLFLYIQNSSSTWRITEGPSNGEAHGLTFSITAAGQVQYTSDASGSGILKFRMLRFKI